MSGADLRAALERLCTDGCQAGKNRGMSFFGDSEVMAPYLCEWRGIYKGEAAAVVFPSCTEDVVRLVELAREKSAHLVPQGGNTGLVGGQIAFDKEHAIVVSLKRMNRISHIDTEDNTLTCEAGCLLADARTQAESANRLFPLSLASEGSCCIGGLLSTNAGGCGVLRYGSAGDLLLGLEVVLADGSVWNGLQSLRKDNTGYDLKRLFVGAEGTLGIITQAVLRLIPLPHSKICTFVAIASPTAGLAYLRQAEALSGGEISAFELMSRLALKMVLRHIPSARAPLDLGAPWYLLVELSSAREQEEAAMIMEKILEEGITQNLILDGVMAMNSAQAAAFWLLRESVSQAQKQEGQSIKHDVSVAVSKIPEFLERASRAVEEALEGIRVVAFGHMGDGNIHFNLLQPEQMRKDAFLGEEEKLHRVVYDLVGEMNGSISAEHGIGIVKLVENSRWKSKVEVGLMRTLKDALDPGKMFNPGKLVG